MTSRPLSPALTILTCAALAQAGDPPYRGKRPRPQRPVKSAPQSHDAAGRSFWRCLLDRQPPQVDLVRPAPQETLGPSDLVELRLRDRRSGLAPATLRIELNQRDVTSSFQLCVDPHTAVAIAPARDLVGSLRRTNLLVVRLADRAGNATVTTHTFRAQTSKHAVALELVVSASGSPASRRGAPDETPLLTLAPEGRTADGRGNDPSAPTEGAAGSSLLRLLTPDYADGLLAPAGPTRRSTREISNTVHAQSGSRLSHRRASDLLWVWGQFLDHDLSLSPTESPPESFPIPVPQGDPFFDPAGTGQVTIPLHRSSYAHGVYPRQQLNAITAWIDGSSIYGSDATRAAALRTNDGTGRLKTSGGDLLPRNTTGLENAPTSHDPTLFLAGDVRANEHVALLALHTLFVREHNRLAARLRQRFPQASGEQVYQAARRIVTAELQAITYQEFLPVLLGPGALAPYPGYQQQRSVGIFNAFSTAAFRFGHSLLSPRLLRLDEHLAPIPQGSLELKDGFFSPFRLTQGGGIEPLLRGAARQVCQELDPLVTSGVRSFLFGQPGAGGLDLPALNIQRGRDHGLPGYNAARRQLGLAPRTSFAEVSSDPALVARLTAAYADVEQIDLWTGALSEDPLPGALVGELLSLLITRQFELLRDGDRFHYEHAFGGSALAALRGTRLVDVIRRNTTIGLELPDDVFTGRLLPFTPNDLTIRAVTADGETAENFEGFVLVHSSDGSAPIDGLVVELRAADQGLIRLQDVAFFQRPGQVVLTAVTLAPRPKRISGRLTLDVELQDPLVYPPPPSTLPQGGALSLQGLSFPGATVELLLGQPATPAGSSPQVLATTTASAIGAYAFALSLPPGTHEVTLRAVDPRTGAVHFSDTIRVVVPEKAPQRLVTPFGPTTVQAKRKAKRKKHKAKTHTFTFSAPATSGEWFVSLVRGGPAVHVEATLNGQALIPPLTLIGAQDRLRVPVGVQASNTLVVRVRGRGSVELRVDGVVPEADLPAGVGRRVARLAPYTALIPGRFPAHTETFSVPLPPSPEGLFGLQVENGSPPVLLASLAWNGERVLAPLPLLQRSLLLPVEASTTNTLEGRALGAFGSSVAVRLQAFLVDEQAPQITIAPAEDALVGPDDLVVVGLVDLGSGLDPSATRVTLNGADVTDLFSTTPTGLQARVGDLPTALLNTLVVRARDRACNEAQATRRFRTGPVADLTLLHPAALRLECADPGGTVARYTVLARDATDPSPVVSCTPAPGALLPLGTTQVTCTATTSDGRTTTASFPITVVDTTRPTLGAASPGFQPASSLPTTSAEALALADLDTDGDLDLVSADPTTGTASVFLNDGRGGFAPPQAFAVGADPRAIALADLDADGHLDLVVANRGTHTITRLLGDGQGGFGPPVSSATGSTPVALSAADLDGDGQLDLAVACRGADALTLLFGDGAGGFPRVASVATGAQPSALAVVDLDVDGRPDLLVTNAGPAQATLHRGQGDGTFEPPSVQAVGAGPSALAVGDLDGDGWLDLVVAHASGLSLLRNDGLRGLAPATSLPLASAPAAVALADLEGDGDLDLIAGDLQLVNQGGGNFGAGTSLGLGAPLALALGDVDRDGRPDLLAAFASQLSLRLGDPAQAAPVVEATSAAGAVVTYPPPPVRDRCDPTPSLACAPASGATFPLGATAVVCSATDASGNHARLELTVTVLDTTPPTLTATPDIIIEQASPGGSIVTYAGPTAADAVDPNPVVVCVPPSGSQFPAGVTVVTCTATDASGNATSQTFSVTVRDTTPPALTQPADLLVEQTGPAGATVTYAPPAATDAVDPTPTVVCAPASGTVFAAGATSVTCTATDAAGNAAQVGFTVTVRDTVAPSLTLAPAPGTVTAAQPTLLATYADGGAGVDLSSFTATLDGVDLTSAFAVGAGSAQATPAPLSAGSHTLVVTLRDLAGNQTSAITTFTVVLADTTPPTLTVVSPAPNGCLGPQSPLQITYADTQSGIDTVSVRVTLNATDVTSAFTVLASGASSTIQALPSSAVLEGTNLLAVTVSDLAGNPASATVSFGVDRTPPVVTLTPAPGAVVAGATVALVVSYVDTGCGGIDPGRFSATLDGQAITSDFLIGPSSATASKLLTVGSHTLTVTLRDLVGNEVTTSSTFTVAFPATALALALEDAQGQPVDPADVPLTQELTVVVQAVDAGGQTVPGFAGFLQLSASDGQVPLDGLVVELTPADQGVLRLPSLALFRTLGFVTLGARSLEAPPANVLGTLGLTVTIEQPLLFPEPPAQIEADGSLTLEGYSFPGQVVELLVDGQVVDTLTPGPTGEYRFSLVLQAGSRTVQTRAVDPATGQPAVSTVFTVVVPLPTVTALRLDPAAASLAVGLVADLRLTQTLSTGVEQEIASGALFQSSAPAVASVDGAGRVLALATGTATITATFAGRSATAAVTVTGAALVETSPSHGEDSVGVLRETVLRFSAPLAPASVTPSAVFAEFAGQRLDARLHLAPGSKTVTLFYDDPLPASARVRVTVLGDQLQAQSGGAIDVDQDGVPGGTALIDFDTLSLTVVEGTSVCGRVFASTPIAGSGGSGGPINMPLAGVTIRVDGSSIQAVTDANGSYRLDPAPAGKFFVHIDGKTATTPVPAGAYYPSVGKPFDSPIGVETNMPDIFLPLVGGDALRPVSTTEATTVTFPPSVLDTRPELAGLQVTVPADSLYANDGTRGGQVGIAPVEPDRLPGPLPENLAFPLVITVQTDGATNFDTPVPVRFPNLESLPPGAKTALWSFNHDTGQWEVVGSMTISADGLWAETDPGVGIRAPGWHGVLAGILARYGLLDSGSTRRPGINNPNAECASGDGQDAACVCKETDEVLLHSGEERFSRTDLMIPGRGEIHFTLGRTYRSQVQYDGPIGHNWNFTYNEYLLVEPNGDIRRVNGFTRGDVWRAAGGGTYTAPGGFFGTLVRQPDGTFVLREPNGFKRIYYTTGLLKAHQDRHGNTMLFDYDADGNLDVAIDPYGREVKFLFGETPDGKTRLVGVRDFMGREIRYTYDAQGDLVEVRTPQVVGSPTGNDFPNGRTERYTYLNVPSQIAITNPGSGPPLLIANPAEPFLDHNLLSATFGEEVANGGEPALRWTYGTELVDAVGQPVDPPTLLKFDRVLSLQRGGTNASGVAAGGITTFDYKQLDASNRPAGVPVEAVGQAVITDRNGNVKHYFVNSLAQHIFTRQFTKGLRPGEPAFFDTRSFFDADGQLLRRIYPEGNEVRYTYAASPRAARRNVTEIRRIADATRGGGADLVTTMVYEPLYQRLLAITDPRGNDASYVPPLGTRSAARYTTAFFFDYQETSDPVPEAVEFGISLAGVPRGLGDLNSDGRTDQAQGNVVRTAAPSVLLRTGSQEALRLGSTTQTILTETRWNDRGQAIALIDAEGNVTETEYHSEGDPDGDGTSEFSLYVVLEPTIRTGYLSAIVQDSTTSPRRTATAPPARLRSEFGYDRVGNRTSVLDPRGVLTTTVYNALNEPVVITRGASVSQAASSGQLLTGEAAFRYVNRIHYDHNARVVRTETENRDGNTSGVGAFVDRTFTYDLLNNLLQSTVEVNATEVLVTQMRYDGNENLILVKQPEGNETATAYDERDLVIATTRGFGSPGASTITIDYDKNANRAVVFDAQDNDGDGQREQTLYAYDGFDRLKTATDALGNQSVTSYDVASNAVQVEVLGHKAGDPTGGNVVLQDTRVAHDELNRVYQRDERLFLSEGFALQRALDLRDGNSDGFVTSFLEFDALSRATFVTEDDGETSQTVYDGASRPIESVDALGNKTLTVYDQNSNPVEVASVEVSAEGLVPTETFRTVYVYDQLNRVARVTDNAGQTTRFRYDSRDNLVEQSDPVGAVVADPLGVFPKPGGFGGATQINGSGNTKKWFYDGLDRRTAVVCDLRVGGVGTGGLDTSNATNPDGQVQLTYLWDGNSRLAGRIDDNGNVTRFGYDALDRKVSQTNADLTTWNYTFDREDNVLTVTDPNGSVSTKSYDVLNRLVSTSVVRAQGVGGTTAETLEYDGLSRLTKCVDDNGGGAVATQTCEFVYDSLSRVLEEQFNGTRTVSSVYSGDSKRLQVTYPGGRVISHTFDAVDRVKRTVDGAVGGSGALVAEASWIGPGLRELQRTYGNGTSLSFVQGGVDTGYDAAKRIVRMRHLGVGGPGAAAFVDRQYGYNRASVRTLERRVEDGGQEDRYSYDSLYRVVLTQLDQAGSGAKRDLQAVGYTLDGVGNRRSVARTTGSGGTAVESVAVNAMNEYTSVGGTARAHSDNGNLRDDGRNTYVFDYKNRLIGAFDKATGNPTAAYLYYCDNRRAKKILYSQASPGQVQSQERYFYDGSQVVEETDDPGNTLLTWVYSPTYVDEPVQMVRSGSHPLGAGTFYMHQNARADVVAVTDGAGAVVERRLFDDYGRAFDGVTKQAVSGSAVGNVYGFQGRRLDSETGLLYFRARYYDPATGRFVQRDPVWDPGNFGNQYSFVGNSPASGVDPSGLASGPSGMHWGQAPKTGPTGSDIPALNYKPTSAAVGAAALEAAITGDHRKSRALMRRYGINSKDYVFVEATAAATVAAAKAAIWARRRGVKTAKEALLLFFTEKAVDEFSKSYIDPIIDQLVDRATTPTNCPGAGPIDDLIGGKAVPDWLKPVLRKYWESLGEEGQNKVIEQVGEHGKNAARRLLKDMGREALGKDAFQTPTAGSGKEKATDVPSEYKGQRPYLDEQGRDFAKRLLGERPKDTGPGSDWNRIKKWGDRAFSRD